MKLKTSVKTILALLLVAVVACNLTACGRKPYTAGVVDGDTYTNDWAGIKVTLPDNYSMLSESAVGVSNGRYQNFDFGCAFASSAQAPVCYVLTKEGKNDIDAIGEEFTKEFGGISGSMDIKQGGVTYQVTVSKDYYTIAGESYLCFHFGIAVGDVYCAFRDVEGTGIIALCVVTMSGGDSEETVFDMFKKMS